jgi:hypothetical protein
MKRCKVKEILKRFPALKLLKINWKNVKSCSVRKLTESTLYRKRVLKCIHKKDECSFTGSELRIYYDSLKYWIAVVSKIYYETDVIQDYQDCVDIRPILRALDEPDLAVVVTYTPTAVKLTIYERR